MGWQQRREVQIIDPEKRKASAGQYELLKEKALVS
jgi:hypothetical protein